MMPLNEKLQIFMQRFAGSKLAVEWFDQTGKKQWAPYCHNQFQKHKGCKKAEIHNPCANCPSKDYSPWTESTARAHIFGSNIHNATGNKKAHGVYPLFPDGTIIFGAIDFDDKHTFLDVQDFHDACASYGLPGHIARSTSKGWHIYFFSNKPIPAIKFRAVILFIIESHSFDWTVRPEIFPKQASIHQNEFGNLIKPPMIHPQMDISRNCFVTNQDVPIGTQPSGIDKEEQWKYLSNASFVTIEQIDDIIQMNDINLELGNGGGHHSIHNNENNKWVPPKSGDFIKVIQGCGALAKIIKNPFSEDVSHEQRFALAITAVNIKNGIDHLRSVFPAKAGDWAQGQELDQFGQLRGSPQLEEIINYAIEKNYKPYTCKRLKEINACKVSKKCLEPKQRTQKEGNSYITLEDQFREPSPVRFSREKDPGITSSDLIGIARSCKGSDADMIMRVFVENLDNIMKLKDFERGVIIGEFSKVGKIKPSLFEKALKQHSKEQKLDTDDLNFEFNESIYSINKEHQCYVKTTTTKDASKTQIIGNFLIDLEEIRTQKDSLGNETVYYNGAILTDKDKEKIAFKIPAMDWHNRRKFPQIVGILSKNKAMLEEKFTEDILRCVMEFCKVKEKNVLTEFGYLGTEKEIYYTPSVVIDKNGIRPNNKDQELDLTTGTFSRYADLCIAEENEFKTIARNFLDNVVTLYDQYNTYPVLGYYFAIPMMGRLNKNDLPKPALWLESNPGTGKSSLIRLMNCLFGDYFEESRHATWTSSHSYLCHEGSFMKDLPYLIDDYKKNTASVISDGRNITSVVIGNYYDQVGRGTLKQNCTSNNQRIIQGYLVATGEGLPRDEGTLSRTIIVNFKPMAEINKKKFETAKAERNTYKCIIPYFIHFLYQYSDNDIADQCMRFQEEFSKKSAGAVCEARITENMGFMAAGFWFMVQFLLRYQIITQAEADSMYEGMRLATERVSDIMFTHTRENQTSNMFIDTLATLISSNSVKIKGYNDSEVAPHRNTLGFINLENNGAPSDENVYIIRDMAMAEVTQFLKKTEQSLPHDERYIGQQLLQQGFLVKTEPKRTTIRKTTQEGQVRIWLFKKSVLGMKDHLRVINNGALEKQDNPFMYSK